MFTIFKFILTFGFSQLELGRGGLTYVAMTTRVDHVPRDTCGPTRDALPSTRVGNGHVSVGSRDVLHVHALSW